MRYLSVCSGIEAATVAWHPLGWKAAAFAEIDDFPSAVLAYRWPDVRNLGDFTKIGADDVGAIDLLVGGTPCQSFSIAGLRGGLGDDRGNLALEFLKLAQRTRPQWMVWENVPGVLSSISHAAPDPCPPPPPVDLGCDGAEMESEDEYDSEELHAFNCFLAGLSDIGYGFAYGVLDAQYFGLAQRRERVFVIGYLGDWRPAAAVLLELESLQGNPAPRRQARKDVTGTLSSRASAGGGLETSTELAPTMRAMNFSDSHANAGGQLAVAFRTTGNDGCYEIGDQAGCLNTATDPNAQVVVESVSLRGREGGATAELGGDIMPSLRTGGGGGDKPHALTGATVRRLTPRECESLQGFPPGYTLIPRTKRNKVEDDFAVYLAAQWRDTTGTDLTPDEIAKLAADGPRYRALGNSMAVPVMAWLGRQIDLVNETLKKVRAGG